MRLISIVPPTLAICMWGTLVGAQQEPQQDSPFYELIINGESFVVRKNRPTVLESKKNPEVVYEVAVRVEPAQQMDLNTVRFHYDWLFTVHDNHDKKLRRVRLVHEAGFTMMITDLGGPIPPDQQIKATTDLVKEVLALYKGAKDLRTEDRHKLDLGNAVLRGVVIRYTDAEKIKHSVLVQTICGKEFAVTCISQYLDNDFEDIKLLIKGTVESFRPIPIPARVQPPVPPGR